MIKEQVRDIRRGALLESLWTELRQSIRALRRNPGMAAMCIIMLALGIGASTTLFSVFEAVLLRPLPFRNADRLVEVAETRLDRGIDEMNFFEANFWDLHDRTKSFESVAAYLHSETNLTGDGEPEKVSVAQVTVGFFRTLGVNPILGRDFSTEEGDADPIRRHLADEIEEELKSLRDSLSHDEIVQVQARIDAVRADAGPMRPSVIDPSSPTLFVELQDEYHFLQRLLE